MVIIRFFLFVLLLSANVSLASAQDEYVRISADACERVMNGESKSSTRLRASDKATFVAVKKIEQFKDNDKKLSDHDFNVMIYRLVDEYVEELSVKTLEDNEENVCVEVSGKILSANITSVMAEFSKQEQVSLQVQKEEVEQIVQEVQKEVNIKPANPENLSLVHIKQLEYFNGSKSAKYANVLKKHIDGNPYFYLTEDAEIADYVIIPKVLKAKVDALDASNKRLHMALVLEISGLEKEIVSEYQNRFVLFGAEENEQNIASRLISKLIEQAGDGAVRKIEHKEQKKLETATLGRTLN